MSHPYESAEEINKEIIVTTQAIYSEDEHPLGCMSGAFMVTVWRNEKPIGESITESFENIGTWFSYDFYAPANAAEIKAAIQTARDEALTAARQRLQMEIEAIQSGKREAELFAAVTALNMPSNQPQLL